MRTALHVNPETAQITAVSDPLPQILEGIPLRLRSIRVDLDRPNFTLNPTNCDPFAVEHGSLRQPKAPSPLPQNTSRSPTAASFRSLPSFTMQLSGSTKRAGNPAVHADLSYPSGGPYANVSRTAVTLPPTELIDNAHIKNPCTKVAVL